MILLRRVIGDALRARRQSQHRTLREVSTAANVSLGYLSEIERGQKEPSSELLAAICEALGAQLSDLLRDISQTVEVAENLTLATVPSSVPAVIGPARRAPDRDANVPVGALSHAHTGSPAHAGDGATLAARAATGPRDGAKLPVPSAIMLPKAAITAERQVTVDGDVEVSVHQDSPLKATLRAKRNVRPGTDRSRDVVCAV